MNKQTIVHIKTEKLIPYASNARTHSNDQVAQIAASIREFGFTNPLLVRDDNTVIAGHGRLLAANKLGLNEVPCIKLSHLSDAQARALVLADNKLAMNAGWDTATLAAEIDRLTDDGFDLSITGFSDEDLSELVDLEPESDADAEPQMDKADELREKWGTKLGQVWQLGEHRLMCGDSTDADSVAQLLGDIKPQLMVTDPPYGVEYDPSWRADAGINKNNQKMGKVENDDNADWTWSWVLFPGDVAYVYHAGVHSATVQHSLEKAEFNVRAQIIWAKDRMALSRGDYHWQHEPCWYAVRKGRKGHRTKDRKQTTLWEIPSRDDSGHGHGTQKPVECMSRPIRNHTCTEVYEPFCGSGTTIIACEQLNRKCFAMELSPAYVAVAIQRWADATGKEPKLIVDG